MGTAGGAAQPGDESGTVWRADAGHRVVAPGGHLLGIGALLGVEDVDGRAGPLLEGDRCWWLTAYFDKEEALFDAVMYVKAGRAPQVPVALGVPLRHRGTRLGFLHLAGSRRDRAAARRRAAARGGVAARPDEPGQLRPALPLPGSTPSGGVGNLIAAPLFKPARDKGAICLPGTETLEPYKDQEANPVRG
jgi:hypothetical protein